MNAHEPLNVAGVALVATTFATPASAQSASPLVVERKSVGGLATSSVDWFVSWSTIDWWNRNAEK